MIFENKTALVTGSGAGIGRAIAERLAAEGANVVVSDVNDAAGAEVVAAITAAGGRAVYQHTAVGDAAEVKALIKRAVDEFGSLDFAVNNAGVGAQPKTVQYLSDAEWARTIDITLTGTFQSLREEIDHMVSHGGGVIVNVSSIASLQPTPNLTPYGAAKHGVLSLTQSVASEYAARGIRVNAVAPGPIATAALASLPQEAQDEYASEVPMKRLGQPEDIANAVAFLLSDQASFITGQTLAVDGGSLIR
ncbi:MAG: SDR family oxidoreductase [Arthrobacter sp.]|jgi:NAD(P)-dependent dehydrogenase (short-subunit alcohol dehydrogenase family)|nr:SDR family oxidoreductase [Arthrobacter sp.]